MSGAYALQQIWNSNYARRDKSCISCGKADMFDPQPRRSCDVFGYSVMVCNACGILYNHGRCCETCGRGIRKKGGEPYYTCTRCNRARLHVGCSKDASIQVDSFICNECPSISPPNPLIHGIHGVHGIHGTRSTKKYSQPFLIPPEPISEETLLSDLVALGEKLPTDQPSEVSPSLKASGDSITLTPPTPHTSSPIPLPVTTPTWRLKDKMLHPPTFKRLPSHHSVICAL